MFEWRTKLRNLKGLSKDDKLWLEGTLMKCGNDVAACYFEEIETDSDTVKRLRPLLIDAGHRKRQASGAEYFEMEFPSASDFARDNRHSIKFQGQIFDVDEKGRTSAIFKDITPLVANGRCAMTRCAAALVHPSIGSAVEDLKVPASELTVQDWDLYHNCAEILPYYWKLEADLQSNMTWVLNEALTAADLSKISPVGNTDGAVVGLGTAPWIGVVEIKRTQETAELQLARYVRDQLAIFNAQPTVAWQTTASPCAALEIVGNEMRLKAFWFETTVCAANLGAAEVRLDSTLEQRRAGAALLRAWLRLLGALHRFQLEGVVQREGLQDLLRTGVPYALAYNDRFTGIVEMRKHRVYSAFDTHRNMKVVVKFVEAYRPDAHRCWAAGGVAVELLDFTPLPANFSMLVVPLLEKDAGWICCRTLRGQQLLDVKGLVAEKLRQAHALTDAANRAFVHGDWRPSNIFIRHDPPDVRVIDLDWSGVASQDRYLVRPNPWLGLGRPRPEAVKCGAVMEQQHDVDTFAASFAIMY